VPRSQQRIGELEARMAGDGFWNSREQAQKVIEESNGLKRKIEPFLKFETGVADLQVLLEIGETEPAPEQDRIQKEADNELAALDRAVGRFELEVLLTGPHDARNAIFSIQSGAGGTESQDWAMMLSRMYQRWFDRCGWKYEVSDALPGEQAGLKSVTFTVQGLSLIHI
jgi:peptide chain release factor 2